MWNGTANGGSPAFVELHAPILHPLIVIPTLMWDATAGAKVAVVGAFALAGLAQLWIGRVLRLSLIPRLWTALLAVVGGHLAGRMELGVLGVVLSTASCSLLIAPARDLALYGRRRTTIILGIVGALAVLSGQGYLQIGTVLSLGPALFVLLIDRFGRLRPVWREFVLAGSITLLLASTLLVPLAHFWPNFAKDIDLTFKSTQPLAYTPLNLVINDPTFYFTDNVLGKLPYPYLYTNYIGWTPILLALFALRLVSRQQRRTLAFLLIAIVLVFLTGSAVSLRLMLKLAPTFVGGIRNPQLISGLAVPLVLALAGWGLEYVLRLVFHVVPVGMRGSRAEPSAIEGVMWLLVLVVLGLSLGSVVTFSRSWLNVVTTAPSSRPVITALKTSTAAWVAPPFGEHAWDPLAAGAQLKMANMVRPWSWKDRSNPQPYLVVTRDGDDRSKPGFRQAIDQLFISGADQNLYAALNVAGREVPCSASARGGDIDVVCSTSGAGELVVQEHSWTGWQAMRDSTQVRLARTDWLTVAAPAGEHRYTFRYRPWDVPLGVGLTLTGVVVAAWLGWDDYRRRKAGPSKKQSEVK